MVAANTAESPDIPAHHPAPATPILPSAGQHQRTRSTSSRSSGGCKSKPDPRKRHQLNPHILPRRQPANPTSVSLLLQMPQRILQRQLGFAHATHPSHRRDRHRRSLLQLLVQQVHVVLAPNKRGRTHQLQIVRNALTCPLRIRASYFFAIVIDDRHIPVQVFNVELVAPRIGVLSGHTYDPPIL